MVPSMFLRTSTSRGLEPSAAPTMPSSCHHLDHACGPVVAHAQPALDKRRGRLAVQLDQLHGALIEFVPLAFLGLCDLPASAISLTRCWSSS